MYYIVTGLIFEQIILMDFLITDTKILCVIIYIVEDFLLSY